MEAEQESLRRRSYSDPPVVEAVVRLQWASPIAWNVTTPGLVWEKIRDLYPDEPYVQQVVTAGPSIQAGQPAGLQVNQTDKMGYSSDGRTRLVTVSPADLSVHGLPPYEGWESLEARLFVVVDRFIEAGVLDSDARVAVVGLRYVNRIEITGALTELTGRIQLHSIAPSGLPHEETAFLYRSERRYDAEERLALTYGTVDAPASYSACVLDLDLYHEPIEGGTVALADARSILDRLKKREGPAFEALISDELRVMFGETGQET